MAQGRVPKDQGAQHMGRIWRLALVGAVVREANKRCWHTVFAFAPSRSTIHLLRV